MQRRLPRDREGRAHARRACSSPARAAPARSSSRARSTACPPRADGPFVKVNCAAIPRELIESELFGHERGAFTGAQTKKRGFFEQAHGGTLFLDEIGDMDLVAQAKVLRALQSGEISRVGSEHVMHVDVRVLAATNKDLERRRSSAAASARICSSASTCSRIRSPALRERVEDIPLLAESFMQPFSRENGTKPKPMDTDVIHALVARQVAGQRARAEERRRAHGDPLRRRVTVADLPEDPAREPVRRGGARGRRTRRSRSDAGRGRRRAPRAARSPIARRVPLAPRAPRARASGSTSSTR